MNRHFLKVHDFQEKDKSLDIKEETIEEPEKPENEVKIEKTQILSPKNKYACDKCDMSFKHEQKLVGHQKSSNGEPLSCNVCDFKTCTPTGMTFHMKKHEI